MTDAAPPEGMTDHDLLSWTGELTIEVQDRQREVAETLHELAACAAMDARTVVLTPPEAWTPTYPEQVEAVKRARRHLEDVQSDLASVRTARDRRLSGRDTESSASSQHFIDTGNYLPADAEVTS